MLNPALRSSTALGRHANAGIVDVDLNVLPGSDFGESSRLGDVNVAIACLDCKQATGRHGVPAINRKIQQRTFQLVRVANGSPKVFIELGAQGCGWT